MKPSLSPGIIGRWRVGVGTLIGLAAWLLIYPASIAAIEQAAAPAASPTPTDFSQVNEILGGRRLLFPDDDVILTSGLGPQAANVTTTILPSAGGKFLGTQSATNVSGPSAFAVAAGRMFNLPEDVVLTVGAGYLNLQVGASNQFFQDSLGGPPAQNVSAVVDLTGDGLAELAFIQGGAIQIVTASDPNDTTKGFLFGTPTPVGPSTSFALATGDFDGGGINELALVSYDLGTLSVGVDIYKPKVTLSGGKVTGVSLSLVTETAITTASPPPAGAPLAAAAGVFSGAINPANGMPLDQLVVSYQIGSPAQLILQPISLSTSDALTVGTPYTESAPEGGESLSALALKAGYLNFFGTREQLALMIQPATDAGVVETLTIDQNLTISRASQFILPSPPSELLTDMAIGNLDQATTNPLGLQITLAALTNVFDSCSSSQYLPEVVVFQVDPTNFVLSGGNGTPVGTTCFDRSGPPNVGLANGDTQGRSLLLGPPTDYTLEHIQPHLVLSAPPMHVDWITPNGGVTPEVLNVSAVPDGFYSQYQVQNQQTQQSVSASKNSFANSVQETGSIGYQVGGAASGSVSVSASASIGFMNDSYVSNQWVATNSVQFDASTQTGFGDQVWYHDQTLTDYLYPVIGRMVCPLSTPNCSVSQMLPETVVFTGVSKDNEYSHNGATLEWYQPVHEAGNVFSYPWTYNQLSSQEAALSGSSGIDLLSSASTTIYSTDGSGNSEMVNWSNQSSNSVTSGDNTNFSWGSSLSFNKTPSNLTGGVSASFSLQYNGSYAFSTTQTSSSSLTTSTGITVFKPKTFPNPAQYQYPFASYILGEEPPAGSLDVLDSTGATVATSGILRTAFTTNPVDSSSSPGAWWVGAYQSAPDVALAHPARWFIKSTAVNTAGDNCIRVNTTAPGADCAIFETVPTVGVNDEGVWAAQALWMKGLLITGADASGNLTGAGPQISQASAGDKILIQARIYNDSLVDIPSSDAIVVQFYAEPWDPSGPQAAGPAFLIDQQTLNGLPGFASATASDTNPNWALVGTTKLDTAKYSGQNLLFWVLVYVEDAGKLVAEIQDHGLTQLPTTPLTSIADALSIVEPYSNNLGFFKFAFPIVPKNAATAIPPVKARLHLDDIAISSRRINIGDTAIISSVVDAKDPTSAFSVGFYDGDPDKSGRLFDVDEVSRLDAGGRFRVETTYQPTVCGKHQLFMRILDAPISAKTSKHVEIEVPREAGSSAACQKKG